MLTKNTFHEHLYGNFSSFRLAEITMKPYQSPPNRGNVSLVRNFIVYMVTLAWCWLFVLFL